MARIDARSVWREPHATGPRLALGLGLALAVAFLIFQATRLGPSTDLGFLWIAGRLWNEGKDAYSPAFELLSRQTFEHTIGWRLSYPPQWWLFCRGLAALPFTTTARVWHFASVACVGATAALLWRTAARMPAPTPAWLRTLFLIVLFTHETVGATLINGQTSLLMLLGVALIADGAVRRSAGIAAAGLFIVMLKPNIGLPFAMVALITPTMRKGLALAILATAALCLPMLASGIPEAIHMMGELVHNLGGYNAPDGYNAPQRMTGLTRFVTSFPTPLTAILAGGVAVALILAGARRAGHRIDGEAIWLHSTASIAALNALHNYDLTFTATPLLLAHRLHRPARIALVAGILLIHSARRLARALHGADPIMLQAEIATVGGMLMLVAALLTAIRGFRPAATR